MHYDKYYCVAQKHENDQDFYGGKKYKSGPE